MRSHRHPSQPSNDDAVAELRDAITRFDCDLERGAVRLSVGGVDLASAEDRRAALVKARAGELDAVEAEVTAYVQTPGKPNRKFRKMAPKAMQKLASSFIGRPVLKNHDAWDVASRAGTIVESKLEREEMPEGGAAGVRYTIRQKFSIVKPWAQEGLLDGTLDALSISWLSTDVIRCSLHGSEIFTKCYCWAGDAIDPDGDDDQKSVVEWVYDGAEGTETSFVNVPAVTEAAVDRIRAFALSLDSTTLAGILGGGRAIPVIPQEKKMDPKLLIALGLPATATAEEAIAAATRLGLDKEKLAIAAEKVSVFEAAEGERRASDAAAKLAADAKRVDAAIADLAAKGKIVPKGAAEVALRAMAARDMASFEAQIADFANAPSVTPVGRGSVPPAPVSSNVDDALAAEPVLKSYLKSAGITKEQFEKHGLERLQAMRSGQDGKVKLGVLALLGLAAALVVLCIAAPMLLGPAGAGTFLVVGMALSKDRDTPAKFEERLIHCKVAATTVIYNGSLCAWNATGFLVPMSDAANLKVAGRATQKVDNSAGGDGDLECDVMTGIFAWAVTAAVVSAGQAGVGFMVYGYDDLTVGLASDTANDTPVGILEEIDANGRYWVSTGRRFRDETLGALAQLDSVGAAEIDTGGVGNAELASGAVDGDKIATIADATAGGVTTNLAGVLETIPIAIPNAATQTLIYKVTDKIEIVDVAVRKSGAGAANTIQLTDSADAAITDAIAAAVDKTVTRAGTIDPAKNVVAAGGTFKIVATRSAGTMAAEVFVHVIRRA